MIYTVKEVTPERILVKFENETHACILIDKNWSKKDIENEISKYVPAPNLNVPFDNVEDVPFNLGDSGNVESSLIANIAAIKLQNDKLKEQENLAKIDKENYQNELLDYKFFRSADYPSIGDQLDALYWSRTGDFSYLDKIDKDIKTVKERFPKDMTPIKRSEITNLENQLSI